MVIDETSMARSDLLDFVEVREKQSELITSYMSDFSKYSGRVRGNDIVAGYFP